MLLNAAMRPRHLISLAIVALSATARASPASEAIDRATRLKAAGDKAGAMAAYQEATRLEPGNALAHNEVGTLLFESGKSDEAIAEFKLAAEADGSYALAYYNYAFAARKAGRYTEAVEAYQHYAQLKPDDPDAKYGLAESFRALGRNTAAATAYEEYAAQETRPSEQPWVEKAKGYAAELRAHPSPAAPTPAAAAAPIAAPQATSDVTAASLAAGDQALEQHRVSDAIRAYQDAVVRAPRDGIARFKLGTAYAQANYFPQAIEQWQQVLQLDPNNQGARDNIQRAQARLSTAQQAAAAPAPVSVPTDRAEAQRQSRADYEQAVGLISQRRYQDAVTQLTAATVLDPSFSVAYVARGSAYVGLGRYQDAVQEYLKGLSLNGNQASPLFGLGEAYRGLGDRPRAAKYYQECADSQAPDAVALRELARKRYADLLH